MRKIPTRRDQAVSAKPSPDTKLSVDERKRLSDSFKAFSDDHPRAGYFFKKS
jgi:hypothetical protein